MSKTLKVRHVVYSHYKNLRWYFVDTKTYNFYFLSLNISDFKYLLYGGINILLPPLTRKHINFL